MRSARTWSTLVRESVHALTSHALGGDAVRPDLRRRASAAARNALIHRAVCSWACCERDHDAEALHGLPRCKHCHCVLPGWL